MSHESAIAGLKGFMKQPIYAVDPSDHVIHLRDESDRSTIILHAGLIEAMLVDRLQKIMPPLNSEEKKELFDFEGPLGSFSNRIRFAHALAIIDRKTRRKIDLLRIMRNVAAHCHSRITFETPQIKSAVSALFGKPGTVFDRWEGRDIRDLYSVACNSLSYVLTHEETTMHWGNLWQKGQELRAERLQSSHEK